MSAAATHTPGPWKQGYRADSEFDGETKSGRPRRNPHTVWQAIEDSTGKKRIATTGIYVHSLGQRIMRLPAEEAEANARLIAAAPDLLAACEAVIDDEGLADLIQAIGEGDPPFWAQLKAAIAKAKGGAAC